MKVFYMMTTLCVLLIWVVSFYLLPESMVGHTQLTLDSGEPAIESIDRREATEYIISSPVSMDTKAEDVIKEDKPTDVITVNGKVVDEGGNPLPEVSVKISGTRLVPVKTDQQGYYQFQLSMESEDEINIQYINLGYELYRSTLKEKEIKQRVATIDVVMQRVSGAVLRGRVIDVDTQQGLGQQRVSLYSPSLDQETRIVSSNDDGRYIILDVTNADDYQIRVQTSNGYSFDAYINESVVQINGSALPLDIFVKKVAADVKPFSIQLASSAGLPIAEQRLQLLQGRHVVSEALTDTQGIAYFLNVPSGEFTLTSMDSPIRVSGLSRDRDDHAIIQTDTGDMSLSLMVIGEQAESVQCDSITLLWVSKQGEYTVRINRRLLAAEDGRYSQESLGALSYTLTLAGCGSYPVISEKIEIAEQSDYLFQLGSGG